ncbi:MAG: extracellular solute-binding protein [Firmicutes bacterium]|nr:extracellular solute-binding protein [Bacillota bacterium]
MRKILILFVLLGTLLLFGCQSEQVESEPEIGPREKLAEELDIYIISDSVHRIYQSEEREDMYYTTFMTLGDFSHIPTTYGYEGFLYAKAFEDYQEETGTNLNITWFEYEEYMKEALLAEETEKPDLILATFASHEDYYLYMDQEMFYDLTALFDKNEIYTSGKYNTQVLSGGKLYDRQYIVPLLFNVDTIMGAESMWQDMSLHLEDAQTHSDIMDSLIYAQKQGEVEQVATQFAQATAFYLPYMLYQGSGEQWIDYENKTVNLDEDRFQRMCEFYQQYVREQIPESDIQQGEKIPWHKSKQLQVDLAIVNEVQLNDFLGEIGCFVEGGGAFQLLLHSAAAQAWYYESRYRDMEEEFQIIPLYGEDGGTTAHISYFGAVMRSSEHPEAAFQFLQFLMDAEVEPFFGLAINRENLEKQLEYLNTTAYELRPGLQMPLEDGEQPESPADYVVSPMSIETKEALEDMIDNIEAVTMPNWPVYMILQAELESYAKDEITMEEAYQNALSGLQAYIQTEGS